MVVNLSFVMSQVSGDGGQVEIKWSDGHLSTYPATWLKERAFNETEQEHRSTNIKYVNFQEILELPIYRNFCITENNSFRCYFARNSSYNLHAFHQQLKRVWLS